MSPSTLPALIALLTLAAPAQAGDSSPPAQKSQDRIAPGVIDALVARALVAEGVKVVDVRTPGEFGAGHVPGAINIPYDEIGRRSAELGPPTTPLVLYCRSGRRSGVAVSALKAKGFSRLYDLQRYDAWVASEPKRP